jgi:hypothetical protein
MGVAQGDAYDARLRVFHDSQTRMRAAFVGGILGEDFHGGGGVDQGVVVFVLDLESCGDAL